MYKKKVVNHWPQGRKEMTVSISAMQGWELQDSLPLSAWRGQKGPDTTSPGLSPCPAAHICANKLGNKGDSSRKPVLKPHLDFGCEKQRLSGWCGFPWIFLPTQNVVPVSFSCFKSPPPPRPCVMLWFESKVSGTLMFSIPGCRTGAVSGSSETLWRKSQTKRGRTLRSLCQLPF